MVVTRSLAGATTVAARGVPEPNSQYSYAVVVTFEGLLASLARRSAEAAIRDVLSARRSVSWTRLDGGAFRLQFTRGELDAVAGVVDTVFSALEASFEDARDRFDDQEFDRAFESLDGE